jgi:aminodeoxyfutalosine deaminase
MIIKAEWIVPMKGDPIFQGAVRVEHEHIVHAAKSSELLPQPGEEVLDLGSSVLAPGLINAHCHLDYTILRGCIDPHNSFAGWIKSINALKRDFTTEDYVKSVNDGLEMLIESGTTTVANIESFPEILPLLGPPPVRTWWFLELIDVRNRNFDETSIIGILSVFDQHPNWLGGFGLSPHAPYTASPALYRLAKSCSERLQMPFTTHVAESVQEHEMFVNARGDLYDLMKSLGRDCSDCGQGSALSHLLEYGLLTHNCLAVHMNYLQDYDYSALSELGVHIVYCPKCHSYFGHRPFELERLRQHGVNICLGTDSLASNNSLDMRAEMREARLKHAGLTNRQCLEMVTLNPAKALNQEGRIGEISDDALADLVAFDMGIHSNPYEAIIESHQRPRLLMVNGQKIDSSND